MIADIFCPIIHPKDHRFSVFYIRKIFLGGFRTDIFTKASPWGPGGHSATPRPPVAIVFDLAKNRCVHVFSALSPDHISSNFSAFIFIFCLEQTLREQIDENDFRHYYGNFSKALFCNYLIRAMFKILSQQLRDTLTTAFERHLTHENFRDTDQHRC